MAKKSKMIVDEEEVNKLLAEKMKEFEKQHTAWIQLKYGNTYVGYDVCDIVTERLMMRLKTLIDMMGIEYSMVFPYGENEELYIMFNGEDKERADFIQKFFDNGYRLSW